MKVESKVVGRLVPVLLAVFAVLSIACTGKSEAELTAPQADLAAVPEAQNPAVTSPAGSPSKEPAGQPSPESGRLIDARTERQQNAAPRLSDEEDQAAGLLTSEGQASASLQPAFTLQLLHAADMDGSAGALENVENFSAILAGFRSQFPDNTLVLSSGDNFIPGPRYFAASDPTCQAVLGVPGNGRGDIALLNAMGFQASALGNHELDHGAAAFASIIGPESNGGAVYPGAEFPYLASNVNFTNDENLSSLVAPDGEESMLVGAGLARSAVVTVSGVRIGIVGATTPALPSLTATGDLTVMPSDPEDIDALADIIQHPVNELVDRGINKIILLAHMQRLDVERALATRLEHVDIIVAGGSNALLADATDRLWPGDRAAETYPLTYESPHGAPVLLVNTDGDYRYLGRLIVRFDPTGRIILDSLDPHLNGSYATDQQTVQPFLGKPIPEVSRIASALRGVLVARDGNVLGRTTVYLAGHRSGVRTQETNLGNLSADAYLWYARLLDPDVRIALKNGGGIRSAIGAVYVPPRSTDPSATQFLPPFANPTAGKSAGDISQFDIEGSLRFNDGLVIVEVTASELRALLEHGVGFDGVGMVPNGRFPQVAGMRFSFDPSAPIGGRIRSVALIDAAAAVDDIVVQHGNLIGDPSRRIKIVTGEYLANGGDGFPFGAKSPARVNLADESIPIDASKSDPADANPVADLKLPIEFDPARANFAKTGTEQDALAEYLAAFHAVTPFNLAEQAPIDDRRIQNLGIPDKTDTVID